MKMRYIKIIANVSFIFTAANFLEFTLGQPFINELVFFWMAVFNILIVIEKYPKLYYKVGLLVLTASPLVLVNGNIEKLIIALMFLAIIYFYRQSKGKLSYGGEADEFKKNFFISVIIVAISSFEMSSYKISQYIIPYAIIYIVVTIILLRYLRNHEYGAENSRADKLNFIYSVVVTGMSFVLAVKSIRDIIFNGISYIYNGIVNILLYISLWPYTMIQQFMAVIFKKAGSKPSNLEGYIQKSHQVLKLLKVHHKSISSADGDFIKTMSIVANILLIIIFFLILNKIFKKNILIKHNNNEEYTEIKETIEKEKGKEGLIKKVKVFFTKGDYAGEIRYYYKKFMEDCISKGISIEKSDTTLDIEHKAQNKFNMKNILSMRNIYMRVKYGDKTSLKDDVDKFKAAYKNRN